MRLIQYLADRLAMYMHAYTLYGFVRPFGCFILLAAYDSNGPQLYGVEPSGVTYVRTVAFLERMRICLEILQSYFGIAVGKAQQTAKTEIEKLKVNIIS